MVRRRECRAMAKALGNLEGNWVEMEVVLKKGLEEVQSSLEMVGSFGFLFLCILSYLHVF
jgi:hypothetical protein